MHRFTQTTRNMNQSPFRMDIVEALLLQKLIVPIFTLYSGETTHGARVRLPPSHVIIFQRMMPSYAEPSPTASTKRPWSGISDLRPNNIASFEQLFIEFVKNYMLQAKEPMMTDYLFEVIRSPKRSLIVTLLDSKSPSQQQLSPTNSWHLQPSRRGCQLLVNPLRII